MDTSNMRTFKIFFNGDVRRFQGTFGLKDLEAKVKAMYRSESPIVLHSGETSTAAFSLDSEEAFRDLLASQPTGPVRIWVKEATDPTAKYTNKEKDQKKDEELEAALKEIEALRKKLAKSEKRVEKKTTVEVRLDQAVEQRALAKEAVQSAKQQLKAALEKLKEERRNVKQVRSELRHFRTDSSDASESESSDDDDGFMESKMREIHFNRQHHGGRGGRRHFRGGRRGGGFFSNHGHGHHEHHEFRHRLRCFHDEKNHEDIKMERKDKKKMDIAIVAGDQISPGQAIILWSQASGKSLRIMRKGEVNGLGGRGSLARFEVAARVEDMVQLRLQRKKDVYIGINTDYEAASCASDDSGSWLQLVEHGDGVFSFRGWSHEKPCGLGVLPDGTAKSADKTGLSSHGRFVVELLD